jgi:arginase
MEADRLTLLGVPIDSVGEAGGTENGPAALRRHLSPGLRDAGDTEIQLRGGERDPESGWLDLDDVVRMSVEVRQRVAEITAAGEVPLILGGCCSLLPAALAGARDSLGEIGLAYLDGHLDLFTGETSPTGEAADMPVAALLGMAPPGLAEALEPLPVIEAEQIVLIGARDQEEIDLIAPMPEGIGIGRIADREDLREADLAEAGRSIAGQLTRDGRRFWLHLDLDILDQEAFPATDYLMDDGLTLDELRVLMAPVASSPGLIGLNLTCFNPDKDPAGRFGRTLADLVEATVITSK